MTVLSLFFYLFASVSLTSSVLVVVSRNPVHSVLFLILTFFNCAALFVLMGAEFLAMLLLVVYIGAIAVLFLFVVMMLNIDFATLRKGMSKNAPIGVLVGLVLFIEIVVSILGMNFEELPNSFSEAQITYNEIENTRALGMVLYTQYAYLFQCAGLILLVAMIGAIVLTHRKRDTVRRQSVIKQVLRSRDQSIDIKKVEIGKGTSK
ncbi:MAG: NADH-quinone oxidoreductase subunit J [Alphaproteobacteria bacterium MarineAlpha9_Bin2]|nr:MAG: NADH-quinone oxidoreductase subunit J [Alphaproteobacteria bacterium MarineAlpha9_Bin1]PPR31273.1 MAG: NADH-quinone oxidoreductase subunit J [Alphaproteobacteria bacterium MarineAlpha9_Bin2]